MSKVAIAFDRLQVQRRGRRLADLTDRELKMWLDACERMELWVRFAKARRTWKRSRVAALEEQAKRRERSARISSPAT
jgi:hypothetical protein